MSLSTTKKSAHSLASQIALLTTSRTVVNTGFRMVFPLLPVFAREVNVEITTLAGVLGIGQLMGLTAPFIGTISERQGRRFTIVMGLLLYTIGMSAVFIAPNIIGLSIALLLGAIGKMAFDPAIQAYIGDRVSYERRGLVIGIIELAWSGAFLLGVPAMTWLIAQYNWQAPFAVLPIFTGVAIIFSLALLENDKPAKTQRPSFFSALRVAVNSRMALAGLILTFSINGASQLVTVVFGTWIESSFGILLSALAAASAVIGASELAGEGIVAVYADKLGKRRLVMLGVAGNIIACLILPFTNFALSAALIGLFLFFLSFELSIVAAIPMATELSPHARAMFMTVWVAFATFGRAVFTPIAPLLFNQGMLVNCLVAIGLNLIALTAVWKFIRIK